jgi:signal transduction histidine kinase
MDARTGTLVEQRVTEEKAELLLRRRASLVIGVLTATLLGSAGALAYSTHHAAKLDQNAISIATNASPAITHLTAALGDLLRIQIRANTVVRRMSHDASADLTSFEESLVHLDRELAAYRAIPFYTGEADQFSEAQASVRAVKAAVATLVSCVDAHDAHGAETALIHGLAPALARADAIIERLIFFNTKQQAALSEAIPAMRDRAARVGFAFEGFTAFFGMILMTLVVRGARQHASALEERRRLAETRQLDLAAFTATLQSILRATAMISDLMTSSARLEPMLRATAEQARSIAGADYCAVGRGDDPEQPFDPWIVAGANDADVEAAPHPTGPLADVMRESRPVRIQNVAKPRTLLGLRAQGPALGPFLGVSIRHAGHKVATLYLARVAGAAEFREDDERATELLATHVGIALDNARLYNEAQAATHAREDLLAVVSHDLKSPLTTIRLSTERLSKNLTGTEEELTTRIARAAARMTDLIGDLLRAAQIEAGRFTVAAQPHPVAPLLLEASEMFALAAAERQVRFIRDADPTLVVSAERPLLLRVFANSIGNALKFTPPSGTIRLAAERSGDLIHFSVADTGRGIDPEALPHLFDRYWQQERTDRRGSGLGLFIAKGIVEAHGGKIWIESELGKGTTVHFTARAA